MKRYSLRIVKYIYTTFLQLDQTNVKTHPQSKFHRSKLTRPQDSVCYGFLAISFLGKDQSKSLGKKLYLESTCEILLISKKITLIESYKRGFKMWPWDQRAKLNNNDIWFYRGVHNVICLMPYTVFIKPHFGGQEFLQVQITSLSTWVSSHFVNLLLPLRDKILKIIWQDGENFNGIVFLRGHPRLRVNLRFLFLVYGY